MLLPDALKLLNRHGVRPINDVTAHALFWMAAPSSVVVLPQGGFVVPFKDGSMYGKKMCDVHMAGFAMESDAVIRFCKSDGKVAVGDLLVGVGRYARFADAQDTILKFIERKDNKIDDLRSLEVDDTLIRQKVIYD